MKRWLAYAMAMTVPLLLLANIWQSCRYAAVRAEIVRLEREETDWVEKNKKALTGIAVLEAPDRIDRIASETLKLQKVQASKILRIELKGSKGL